MQSAFDWIPKVTGDMTSSKPRVAFLEWHDPLFAGGHWIPDMLEIAGCSYEMGSSSDRSKAMKDEELGQLDPDVILIGPCGFSLDRAFNDTLDLYEKKAWFKEMRAVKEGRAFALDGNSYYARPGPRLLQGCGIMAACIHGDQVAEILGEELAPSGGIVG
ncbi:chromosome 1 open reading frame 53 [Seminavis robusta]|uniref:Chromosome 1 open reading frame 53 n=1 Tax=Seminavis robusta TaxID=568900 RepID=A0A9N8EYL6_9STRA|nr:chromosome 1 open reading frame 53 [Seminavis robusta]|eukprot:Sro2573_g331680.1 chromosome 1 open reading frame 53 (160) ;mRNA; f:3357-3836